MGQVPLVTLCVAFGQQNEVFDARVTGLQNPDSIKNLVTQVEAAGFTCLKIEAEAGDTRVCTFQCASGDILQSKHESIIQRAVEAAGMVVAL